MTLNLRLRNVVEQSNCGKIRRYVGGLRFTGRPIEFHNGIRETRSPIPWVNIQKLAQALAEKLRFATGLGGDAIRGSL